MAGTLCPKARPCFRFLPAQGAKGMDMSPYANKTTATFRVVQASAGTETSAYYIAAVQASGIKVGG